MLASTPMPRTAHPELSDYKGISVRRNIPSLPVVVAAEAHLLDSVDSLPVAWLSRRRVAAPAPFVGPSHLVAFYSWPVWTDGRLWIAGEAELRWTFRPFEALPLHRTEAGYPSCSTCDGGGCPDCTDPA